MFKERASRSRSRINRIDNQNWVRRLKSCPLVKLCAEEAALDSGQEEEYFPSPLLNLGPLESVLLSASFH